MTLPNPIASDVFTDGELTNELKWYQRVFSVINQIIDFLQTSVVAPHFYGGITAATAITAGQNIPFAVVEDTDSGWDANAHAYTSKKAGLYEFNVQTKWDKNGVTAEPRMQVLVNGTPAVYSPNAYTTAQFAGLTLDGWVRLNVGDVFAVQVLGANFGTQSDAPAQNNYLNLRWIAA